MVKIYAGDIRKLPDPKERPALLVTVSEKRKKETMKFSQAADRRRSLGAGLLLQKVLPCYGVFPDQICREAGGKPTVQGIGFNLSHSGDFVVCAVGEKSVGCDVEKIKKAPMQVAKRFFGESEAAYVQAQAVSERDAAFFRLWTMKESYIKMTGEGMSLPLDGFTLLLQAKGARVRRDGKILSCRIWEYEMCGYKLSVCATEEFAPEITYIDLMDDGA